MEKKHLDEQQDSGGDLRAHRRIRALISRVCVRVICDVKKNKINKKSLQPGLKKGQKYLLCRDNAV